MAACTLSTETLGRLFGPTRTALGFMATQSERTVACIWAVTMETCWLSTPKPASCSGAIARVAQCAAQSPSCTALFILDPVTGTSTQSNLSQESSFGANGLAPA